MVGVFGLSGWFGVFGRLWFDWLVCRVSVVALIWFEIGRQCGKKKVDVASWATCESNFPTFFDLPATLDSYVLICSDFMSTFES